MRVLICTVDQQVCPPEAVQTLSLADSIDPALFGVTPEGMAMVFGGGMGLVLFFFFAGWAVGLATGLIKKV